MLAQNTSRRSIALFVVLFLCLNISGVICLSYCAKAILAAADRPEASMLSEHCRRMKKEVEEKNSNASKLETPNVSCCMMPSIVFAAPLEKRSSFELKLIEVPSASVGQIVNEPIAVAENEPEALPVYRPPPLDRRVERVLNCVIRI